MLKYNGSFSAKGKTNVADGVQRGNETRRIVTNKERQRRLKAVKRKKMFLRTVFVLLGLAIVAGIAALTVTLVKAVKRMSSSSRGADKYYCSVFQLENAEDGNVVCTEDEIFIFRSGVLTCADAAGVTLWTEDFGEGIYELEAFNGGVVVYAIGGKEIRCFSGSGLLWERTGLEPISFVVLGENASRCLVCTEPEDCLSKIVLFSTKNSKTAEETLLEKKFRENHLLSAAISPAGKSIAVVELRISDTGEDAATRVIAYNVATGQTLVSKLFENEVCPYCSFAGETSLVAAGRKNVHLFEKLSKNNVGNVKYSKIVSIGDAGNDVIAVTTIDKKVVAAVGTADGKSDVKVYDADAGTTRSFPVPRAVKGFLGCGGDVFVCFTQTDFLVYDFDGNEVSSCEEKIDIDRVKAGSRGFFAVSGDYGTSIINVKKAA